MYKIKLICLLLTCIVCNAFTEEDYSQTASRLQPLKNDGKYWPESTRFLVIVHQYDGDVSWASRLKFPYIIYEKDKPEKEPFSAINKAKGETNLLKFIAEFYDDLPENIIQVYQYEYKFYHQGSLVDIINSPEFEQKYAESKTRGFWNFNAVTWHEDPPIQGMLQSGWWPQTMAPTFGDIYDYGNFLYGKKACSQFVVSRDRIRTLPREFYCNMYFWLAENSIGEIVGFDPVSKVRIPTPLDHLPNSNYFTSRCMEKSWELIFTTLKPDENIAIPLLITDQNAKYFISHVSAKYGAKKYFRDVTSELTKDFLYGKTITIPAEAVMNDYFTDVTYGLPKTLIININGDEYLIPELRSQDMTIDITQRKSPFPE